MKKTKRILALVLALAMVFALTATVFADGEEGGSEPETPAADTVTITVTRDSSYAGEATEAGNSYKWYKIFSASYAADFAGNSNGGHDASGNPLELEGEGSVAYTATAAVAAKLGTWVAATGNPGEEGYVAAHWQRATGNEWFDLTPIAGSTDYVVTWGAATKTQDDVQEAGKWLVSKGAYEKTGDLTFADSKWSASGLDKGYYVLVSAVGENVIAATTDVDVKEKISYPPLDKTQRDEDHKTQTDSETGVSVGDVLTYQVKVTIPATAKVGDRILAWDKPSAGLTYNNDLTITNEGTATITDDNTVTGAAWAKLITVTESSKGKDVVFTYTMTVNSDALTDTDKKNDAHLKYGNENDWIYDSIPESVEFKTYFAGIKKVDGEDSKELAGVKFTLKENGVEFKVKKVEGKDYYIPDETGSSEVVTDANGNIRIRGLDGDKTYTLTETETLPGYNLLDSDVTLTLKEDTYTVIVTEGEESTTTTTSSYDGATDNDWGKVENNKGTLLPSTGGIGTTIFYIIGGILVVGAGVVLIARRRMSVNA